MAQVLQLFPRSKGDYSNTLFIETTCPKCQEERWVEVSSVRTKGTKTPYCAVCASSALFSGSDSPRWKGGRIVSRPDGYIILNVNGLTDEEKALAQSMATAKNQILEHRLIMGKHLGRPLTPDEIVHHRNSDRSDNRLANLRLTTRRGHWTAPADEISSAIVDIEDKAREIANMGVDILPCLEYINCNLEQIIRSGQPLQQVEDEDREDSLS